MNLANTRLQLSLLSLIHVVNGGLIKRISWHASSSAFTLSLIGKDFRSYLLMVCMVNCKLSPAWAEYSYCKVKISQWIFFKISVELELIKKYYSIIPIIFIMLQYLVNYIYCNIYMSLANRICRMRFSIIYWSHIYQMPCFSRASFMCHYIHDLMQTLSG